MAVKLNLFEPPVTLLDHEEYLIDIYDKDIGYVPKKIFNIFTPFRMDLEAQKIAHQIEDKKSTKNLSSKSKRKNLSSTSHMSKQEVEELDETVKVLSKSLCLLKSRRPELFYPMPNIDLIKDNNRNVRCLVNNIQAMTTDVECPLYNTNMSHKSKAVKIKGT